MPKSQHKVGHMVTPLVTPLVTPVFHLSRCFYGLVTLVTPIGRAPACENKKNQTKKINSPVRKTGVTSVTSVTTPANQ